MPLRSPLYSIPYLLILTILLFLYMNEQGKFKNGIKPKTAANLAFFLMLWFLGMRGHLLSDCMRYFPLFDNLAPIYDLNINSMGDGIEPGFLIYSSLIKTIFPNYYVWVFINTSLDLLVLRWLFKRYTHSTVLPFIFFMAYQGFALEVNFYRNIKAIDLFLISIPYLQSRKMIPYMLLNLLGLTFHYTAILYIMFYFVLYRKIPNWIVWTMLILANVTFWGNMHITSNIVEYIVGFSTEHVAGKLNGYANNGMAYGFSIGYLERTVSILICFLLLKKLVEQNPANRIFFNAILFYYFTFLFFADITVLTERVPIIFIFSYWLLFTNLVQLKFKLKQVAVVYVILISFMKMATETTLASYKYDNLLWGIESLEQRSKIQEQVYDMLKQ